MEIYRLLMDPKVKEVNSAIVKGKMCHLFAFDMFKLGNTISNECIFHMVKN